MRRTSEQAVMDLEGLEALIGTLRDRGYRVIGPTVREGAVEYDQIETAADLPQGWGDDHQAGRYALRRRDDDLLFGFASAPQSWKRFLFPPRTVMARARRTDGGVTFEHPPLDEERFAFLGVRPCDLAAIEVQDRVFLAEGAEDPTYATRRRAAFIVVVNCGEPAATCFCASMGTGPRADRGFDLSLTEVRDAAGHRFLVEAGSEEGAEVAAELGLHTADDVDVRAAASVTERARARMGRSIDTEGLPGLLQRNRDHPRWAEVAQRCLGCTNCTLVCPTCFCNTLEDATDLAGASATRTRRWDSCFTLGFSEMGGDPVRTSTAARYRQWMTHKLDTWWEQFGTSGCVGCGRCITWCPVGIDITEELAAIRAGGTT